jgi:glyoxylase-like metal-dependent hydrolase (beta-lactamase superfamily II)
VRKKIILGVVALLLLLPIIAVVAMRLLRSRGEEPLQVTRRILRMRNLFTEIYGARVGDKVILFDAGIDSNGSALDTLLGALEAKREDVSDIFLTHGHFDHVAAAPLCKNARVHVGAADVSMLAGRSPQEPVAARWFAKILPAANIFAQAPYEGREEIVLSDGTKITAIPLPGHTPGSYVLHWEGVLFAGDSVQINDGELQFAMPAFTVDSEANKRGVKALQGQLAGLEIGVICTGHQACIADAESHLEAIAKR